MSYSEARTSAAIALRCLANQAEPVMIDLGDGKFELETVVRKSFILAVIERMEANQ
jgi:hypothetical protein